MVQPSQFIQELAVIRTLMALPTRFGIFAAMIRVCDKLYGVGNFTMYSLLSLLHNVLTDNETTKYMPLISLLTMYKASQTCSSSLASLCPSFPWSN